MLANIIRTQLDLTVVKGDAPLRRRIPEEIVEKVRQQFDIVDVIGEHVRLKKTGRGYSGLCPFHNEKSPSFSVSPDKQLYHCFGCGVSGNLFSFLMDKEGITFFEAVEQLAKRANIALPMEEMEDVESPEYRRRKEMFRAHDLAAKYYHHILMNTEAGRPGLQYLESRGLSRTTIETFGLGFAPDSWDVLRKFLLKRGFEEELLVEAGLLSESSNRKGRYFDKFRNRVMFPIHDGQGQVIAFGGRVMSKEEKPKYLNSPETPLFHKGRHLYNLHRARPSMRKENQAILLEGYMDVIAAYQNGVEHVVAALGTAMTNDHVRILSRNVEEIIMTFDGDEAGQRAALRSLDVVKETGGVKARVATLPDGLDPDEFLGKFGKDAFIRAISDQSSSMTTYRVLALRKEHNLATQKGRDDYLEEVAQKVLAEVKSPIELEREIKSLSEEFGISQEALMQTVQQGRKSTKSAAVGDKPDRRWNTNRYNAPAVRMGGDRLLPAYIKAERMLLTHMLIDEGVARQVQEALADEFSVDEHGALAIYLYAFYAEHDQALPEQFISTLEDRELVKLASTLLMKADELDMRPGLVEEYIRTIRVNQLEKQAKRYEQELIDCGNRGDLAGMRVARDEMNHIKSYISALKSV